MAKIMTMSIQLVQSKINFAMNMNGEKKEQSVFIIDKYICLLRWESFEANINQIVSRVLSSVKRKKEQ